MEIKKISPPYLFAAHYSGDRLNIYRLIYKKLTDEEYVTSFFVKWHDRISDYIVNNLGHDRDEIEEYMADVHDRMIDIDEEISDICDNIKSGKVRDFGMYFVPHSNKDYRTSPDGGGKSCKYHTDYLPVKCWGSSKPSLVRIYAIELTKDCYIITYGGIKIDLDTNDCPDFDKDGNESTLEEEIRKRVIEVCDFLERMGITDKEGLIQYMEEEHDG